MFIRIIPVILAFYLLVEIVYAQSSTQPNVNPIPEVSTSMKEIIPVEPKTECPLQIDSLLKTLESQKAEIEALKRQNEILKNRLEEIWEIINWHPKTTIPN